MTAGSASRAAEPGGPESLREALHATGAIGATPRQLAARTDQTPEDVQAELDRLAERGEVLRIGRGLWVLHAYRTLESREDFVDPQSYVEKFGRENGVALGTYSGPITFRANEETPVHRWWPYVQGYSAEFVGDRLAAFEIGRRTTVLDPFAGSGTTLVEARRRGARAIGCELLPPAALSARVKTRFELRASDLRRAGRTTLVRASTVPPAPEPFLRETRRQFSSAALRELRCLRAALPLGRSPVDEATWLAFDRILIPSSRLRRSPCLGYGKPDAPGGPTPTARFSTAIAQMADDLEALRAERASWGPPASVVLGDARSLGLPNASVDLAVTSPPYVNGMDYVMNYKVDLAWLGYANSYADLRRLRSRSVACDNLPRFETAPYADSRAPPDPWLREILGRIERNVRSKRSYRRDDMHAVVHRYFADLVPVIQGVYRALRPGGRFLLVVGDSLLAGTYVPGDLLLARIAAGLGFRIESVDVARSRRSGQRRSFALRETVVTLRKPTG